MNDQPVNLHAERIKRTPPRDFVMVHAVSVRPVSVVDLYRDGRDLQRIGITIPGASLGAGITAEQARALAAELLVAADTLDSRRLSEATP